MLPHGRARASYLLIWAAHLANKGYANLITSKDKQNYSESLLKMRVETMEKGGSEVGL